MRTPRFRLPCFLGLVLAFGACERQAANPSEPIASTSPRVSQSLTELLRTKSETEDLTPFGGAELSVTRVITGIPGMGYTRAQRKVLQRIGRRQADGDAAKALLRR